MHAKKIVDEILSDCLQCLHAKQAEGVKVAVCSALGGGRLGNLRDRPRFPLPHPTLAHPIPLRSASQYAKRPSRHSQICSKSTS
jgi:hypothetical protein